MGVGIVDQESFQHWTAAGANNLLERENFLFQQDYVIILEITLSAISLANLLSISNT